MTAEYLGRLWNEAERLHSFLNRDLAGWAPVGTDTDKLRRTTERAWARSERRRLAMFKRLAARVELDRLALELMKRGA